MTCTNSWASRFRRPASTFTDVHHAVACAATGDAAGLERLIGEMRERLAAGKQPAGPGLATLAEAFGAFARSDWNGAISLFEQALPETVRIGGSRAQRDLVAHTMVAAYLRAGRADDARQMMVRRDRAQACSERGRLRRALTVLFGKVGAGGYQAMR